MKPGDRVETPDGPGTVVGITRHAGAWINGKPPRPVYEALVELDGRGLNPGGRRPYWTRRLRVVNEEVANE